MLPCIARKFHAFCSLLGAFPETNKTESSMLQSLDIRELFKYAFVLKETPAIGIRPAFGVAYCYDVVLEFKVLSCLCAFSNGIHEHT